MGIEGLVADFEARGLVHDCTDLEALARRLADGPVTVYHGIDPTADSLHVGHLVGVLALRRFQLDHVCAHPREQLRARRSGLHVGHVEDANSFESFHGSSTSSWPKG